MNKLKLPGVDVVQVMIEDPVISIEDLKNIRMVDGRAPRVEDPDISMGCSVPSPPPCQLCEHAKEKKDG